MARLSEAAAPSVNEGADAEEDVDEAEESEGSLLDYRGGVRERDTAGETNGVDGRRDHEEKDKQGHGDGDVHPEHAFLRIFCVCQDAEEDEEDANAGGD